MAVIGGTIHPPTNYDGLAYRTPRVLHWLAEGRWHWIHTEFQRLNTRAPGFEWVSAPFLCIFKTDRWLFLINVISFLLMPALTFSVLRRVGVRRKVAWHWMWLIPTGYGFLLQAASIGNDLFGAVFVLAAVDFALRARETGRVSELWVSLLAAALLTSAKASSIPLGLPWLVATVPSVKLLRGRLLPALPIFLAATLSSFLPQAVLNSKYGGDWSGMITEKNEFLTGHPFVHVANNLVLLPLQNLVPPIFPLANAWNQAMHRVIPAWWQAQTDNRFEPAAGYWELSEMETEERAGLGFGVTSLLLLSFMAAKKPARAWKDATRKSLFSRMLLGSAGVALLAYMAKSGLASFARVAIPYYALVIPALLIGEGHGRLVQNAWWRRGAIVVFAIAGILLIVSPARPLWPAITFLKEASVSSPLVARSKAVYSVYSVRADAFAHLRTLLPPELKVVGLISFDDPETSLWCPFGQRRIEHVIPTDTLEEVRARGIEYILVSSEVFSQRFSEPFSEWIERMRAEIVSQTTLTLRVNRPVDWHVVRLRAENTR